MQHAQTQLRSAFFTAICLILPALTFGQAMELNPDKSYQAITVGYYNVENLFDTLDTENKEDEEFLPDGPKLYGTKRYTEKLGRLARVISEIGTDLNPDGLALVGVSEIENEAVLKDLAKEKAIADRNYQIIHYESPGDRGIDVALMYNPKYFTPTSHKSHELTLEHKEDFKTRDQLVVTGDLLGEEVSVLVNHWPSRRGGEKASAPLRQAAAELNRTIIDSLFEINSNAKLLTMGDFNDDPVDLSMTKKLDATGKAKKAKGETLYNPMYPLYKKGIGSLAYRDNWNLFDQIVISSAWLNDDPGKWRFYGAKVYNKDYLKQKEGNFKGYPFRTFVGDTYMGGYSDHFPVYLILVREVNTASNQ